MAELSKTQLGSIITLAVLISGLTTGAITYNPDNTYYCESRDLVRVCDRLSDTGKTCYYADESNKICTEGWEPISDFVELNASSPNNTVRVSGNNREWLCDQMIVEGVPQKCTGAHNRSEWAWINCAVGDWMQGDQ